MRSLGFRLLLFTLAPLALGSTKARADWWPYTETAFVSPVSATVVTPTSSVYATAYYPETYAWTPTAYYQSSYPVTGYYYQERVARRPLFSRPLFGRRRDYVVPTTVYYPTTMVVPTTSRYYAPTVFDYPLLTDVRYQTASNGCGTCDNSVVTASTPAQGEERIIRDEVVTPRVAEPSRRAPVESNSLNDQSTIGSNVSPAPNEPEPSDLNPTEQPKQAKGQSGAASQGSQTESVSPPTPPAAQTPTPKEPPFVRDTTKAQPAPTKGAATSGTQAAPAEKKSAPPTAPAPRQDPAPSIPEELPAVAPVAPSETDLPAAGDDKPLPKSRESLKPSSYGFSRPAGLTLLKGRVQSSASSNPEDGVRITISSRTNAFEDRTAYSNEAGRFALKVPDGDWTVKVTMPSGRVYPVYQITVSSGLIIDDQGQDVPALVITR